jgi:hypothetical protein
MGAEVQGVWPRVQASPGPLARRGGLTVLLLLHLKQPWVPLVAVDLV